MQISGYSFRENDDEFISRIYLLRRFMDKRMNYQVLMNNVKLQRVMEK